MNNLKTVSFVHTSVFNNSLSWCHSHAYSDGDSYTVCGKYIFNYDNVRPSNSRNNKPSEPSICGFCMADIESYNDKLRQKKLPVIDNPLLIAVNDSDSNSEESIEG